MLDQARTIQLRSHLLQHPPSGASRDLPPPGKDFKCDGPAWSMASDGTRRTLVRGSCLCGAVSFEVDGPLEHRPEACHCSQCRKQTSHVFVGVNVRRKALTVHRGDRVTSRDICIWRRWSQDAAARPADEPRTAAWWASFSLVLTGRGWRSYPDADADGAEGVSTCILTLLSSLATPDCTKDVERKRSGIAAEPTSCGRRKATAYTNVKCRLLSCDQSRCITWPCSVSAMVGAACLVQGSLRVESGRVHVTAPKQG